MLEPNAILGVASNSLIMWQNGTQPIWKGLAQGLNVKTNAGVERINRNSNGVEIYTKGDKMPQHFDKLIVAVDPKSALSILDATDEETSLFSKVQYMPYSTFAVRVAGLAEGKSEVGYLRENMVPGREGRPMAWVKRYADDNMFVFHLFAPKDISDEQVMENITQDMKHLGARKVTLVDSRRWSFFPHVDAIAMREGKFYERARNLQGLNNTVFVNEALAMSTMPDSVEQGKKAAQRLASGEY